MFLSIYKLSVASGVRWHVVPFIVFGNPQKKNVIELKTCTSRILVKNDMGRFLGVRGACPGQEGSAIGSMVIGSMVVITYLQMGYIGLDTTTY